jgi:hypothetical protein
MIFFSLLVIFPTQPASGPQKQAILPIAICLKLSQKRPQEAKM